MVGVCTSKLNQTPNSPPWDTHTHEKTKTQAFEEEAAAAEAHGAPWAKEKWYGTVHKLERIPEVSLVCVWLDLDYMCVCV